MKPCNRLDYPEEDLVCVLTASPGSTGRRCQLVKKYENGVKQKAYLAKEYTYRYFYVPDLAAYRDLLKLLQNKKHSCIIHGLPKSSWKRNTPGKRNKDNIIGTRDYRFLTFDIDGPAINDWRPTSDARHTFNQVYDRLASELPAFADTELGVVIHLTSGWGQPDAPGPRMRITFRLDQAVSTKEMELLQKEIKRRHPDLMIDPAIYRPGQIVYTADPIGADYEGARVFLKKGKNLEWNEVSYGMDVQVPEYAKLSNKQASTFQTKLFEIVRNKIDEAGMLKGQTDKMTYIICPWEGEHSSHTHDSSTAIFQTENGMPAFKCMHTTCDNHHWNQFMIKLQEDGILDPKDLVQAQHEDAVRDFADAEPAKKSLKPIVRKRRHDFTIFDLKTNFLYVPTLNKFIDRKSGNLYLIESLNSLFPHIQNPHIIPGKKSFYGQEEMTGVNAWKYVLPAENIQPGIAIDDFRWIPDPAKVDELIQEHDGLYYNTFKGFPFKPEAGDCTDFVKHVRLLYPDDYAFDWFMNWLAHMIQRPWEKPTTAPVHIFRKQGLGRGLLHQFIMNILNGLPPKQVMATSTTADILLGDSQFNEHFFQKLYIGVEETETSRKRAGDKLKDFITATSMTINAKGMPKRESEPMYYRMFFMTNKMDALPIDPTDRRFFVYMPNDDDIEKPSGDYYVQLYKLANEKDYLARVLYYLAERDISQFNVYADPPQTAAKEIMIESSRDKGELAIERIKDLELPKCPAYTEAMLLEAAKLSLLEHGYTLHNIDRVIPAIHKQIRQWPRKLERQIVAKRGDKYLRRTLYFFNGDDYIKYNKQKNKQMAQAAIERTRQAIKKELKQSGIYHTAHHDFEEDV